MIPEADYYITKLNQLQNLADNYRHIADDNRRLANERAGEIDELRRQLAECRQESELFFASLANRDQDVVMLEQERDRLRSALVNVHARLHRVWDEQTIHKMIEQALSGEQ